MTVELKAKSPGGKIRFTLDGSDPAAASPEYTEPLTIDSTTLVKAKTFEAGVAPSLTVAQAYTQLDSSLATFTSNLPLVIINTYGQPVSKEQSVTASLRVIEPSPKRSSLPGKSGFDGQCEIKLRGYSSLRQPKRSFTIKTRDGAGQPLSTPLLGMPKDSDWVLYAPYSDKTLMRDVLAYELSNKLGRYAARTRFVEVFLVRNNGKLSKRDYVGVYVLEEKIKRSPDRVRIQKLTPEDKAEPEITGGYIFQRDHENPPGDMPFGFFGQNQGGSSPELGFRTSRGVRLFYVDPKEADMTAAQKTWLSRYLNQFERALYGANFRDPNEGYAKFLDVDSFIDQFWIVELSKNVDGFRYSCYMTKDRGGKIKLEPIWDWNLSFGNANYHEGWMTDRWYWRLLRPNEISWFRRLSQDPEFMQRLAARWLELRKDVLSPQSIQHRIDEIAEELREAQKRNFQRWPILGQSVNPNWFVGSSYQEEVDWMKNWIEERIAWIDSQFQGDRLKSPRARSGDDEQ
ncbi:MAG: CotH kinase family protein [Verrucomicrobiota bacterium]